MGDGIYVALSGAIAQMDALDATSTNLANAATDGYQRLRPIFREALNQATAESHAVGSTQMSLDTTRGALRSTGRALDVVVPDKSYLAVTTTRGERYTRASSLKMTPDGTLHTSHGEQVAAEGGAMIRANPKKGEVTVTASGEVRQGGTLLARLRLVTFDRPEALAPEGGTLLAATTESGTARTATGTLEIGAVEESNTSAVGSMTELVSATRSFDAFQRAIDAFRDADRKVVETVPNDT